MPSRSKHSHARAAGAMLRGRESDLLQQQVSVSDAVA